MGTHFKKIGARCLLVLVLVSGGAFLFARQNQQASSVDARVTVAGVPSVVSTTPAIHSYGVAANSSIFVTFSEAVSQASVTSDTFVVVGNQTGRRSAGSFTFTNGDATVEFAPTNGFDLAGEKVTVTLTTGIESAATADPLDQPYTFSYTVDVPDGFANFGLASSTPFNNDQSLGVRPSDVKLGDLNADGNLDLVITNLNGGLERWLGDGLGGFASPVDIVISTPGLQGRPVALAPMNDDDFLDIIFVHESNDIEIHLNDGSGGFGSEMTVDRLGNNVAFGDVAPGDFNGDGLTDFAMSQYASGNVFVFLNNGTELVYDATYAVTAFSLEIYAADLDNDYDLDLIIEGGSTTDAVGYLLNDGDANFTVNSTDANFGVTDHVVVDQFLPADDFNHLLIANDSLSFGTNNGTPSFTWSQPDVIFNEGIRDIFSGDLDGDDDPDVVTFSTIPFNSDWYEILINNSVGAQDFAAGGQISTTETPIDGALGDINNNGVLDMVAIYEGAPGTFNVWMGGQFAPSAITDLDGAPGDTQVELTWSEPSDGGSAITDYVIEYGATAGWPGNAAIFDDGVSDLPDFTVTGLVNGIDYTFVVYAVNAIGTSDASNETNTTPADLSNWTTVVIDQGGNITGTESDMVAPNANHIFVSYRDEDTEDGLLGYSTDGGATWDNVFMDSPVMATSIDAVNSTRIYSSYLWTDEGPLEEVWVWRTDDYGGNLDYIAINESGTAQANTSITVVDDDTFFVAYTTFEGVIGDSFLDTGAPEKNRVNSASVQEAASDNLVRVARSSDAGVNIDESVVGSGMVTSASAIDAFDASTIYLVYYEDFDMDLKSAVSTDGGQNWTITNIDTDDNIGGGAAIKVIDALTAYVVYTNDNDQTLLFAKTTDGGTTWTGGPTPVVDTTADVFDYPAIDATDANNIFITAPNNFDFQYYFSTDGGVTWDGTTHLEPDEDDSEAGYYSSVDAVNSGLVYITGYRVTTGELVAYRIAAEGLQSPVLIRPQDGAVVTTSAPVLSAWYEDPAETGTTEYRISSSSLLNCVSNIDIVDSGTSAETESEVQPTTFEASGLVHGETYYWCARNDNGTEQTDWRVMGEFTVNLLYPEAIQYSTYLGGSDDDAGLGISVDGGNVFIVGHTLSNDFPATPGSYDTTHAANSDIFVVKLSPNGAGDTDLIYSTYIGGTSIEVAKKIDVAAGVAYIVGETQSTDFPIGASVGTPYDLTKGAAGYDVFIAQLSVAGDDLLYSTYLGGADYDYVSDVIVNGGLLYLTGTASSGSTDFPATVGAYDTSHGGRGTMFVSVFDPSGNGAADLQYSTFLGANSGAGGNSGESIFVENDLIYTLGSVLDVDFPVASQSGTPYQTTNAGDFEGTLTVIDPQGAGASDLIYSTYIGTASIDATEVIFVDSGIVYVGGYTDSSEFPITAGAYDSSYEGETDAIFMVFDPSGYGSEDLLYSTFLGGGDDMGQDERIYAIQLLSSGRVAVAGTTNSTDFPTSTLETISGIAGFLTIIDPTGHEELDLIYSTHIDGSGDDYVYDLDYDGTNLYVSGLTTSEDFPSFAINGDSYDSTSNGGNDAFLALFAVDSELDPATVPPDAPTRYYPDEAATRAGVTILAAHYSHDVLPGTTEFRVSSTSAADCLSGTNIVATGSSASTTIKTEPTFFQVSALSNGTKYWCARNDNGTTQSNWTTMGTFIQDSSAPYLNYSTFFGGTAAETVGGFDVEDGVVYITGVTDSANFPVTPGAYDESFNNTEQFYIAGFSLEGNGAGDLLFATYFGANSTIFPSSIDVEDDKIYVIGETNATDVPYLVDGGGTPFDDTVEAGPFILRFNNDASVLEYSTHLMPRGIIGGDEIRVENGLVYAVGPTQTNLPTTAGAYDTTYNTGIDFYVMVLDLQGNGASDLLYSTYLGGGGFESLRSIDVHDGIVYLAGYSDTGSYPVTVGAFDTVKAGFGTEGVVSVLDPSGNGSADLLYSTFMGGNDQETVASVLYNASTGYVVGCGSNGSGDMTVTTGAYKSTSDDDGYFFVLDPSGNGASDLIYGSYGGNCTSAFLRNDDLYMIRPIDATFPITDDAYSNDITQDGFGLLRFSLDGNGTDDLVYGTRIGNGQTPFSLHFEGDNIYLASTTSDQLYPFIADSGNPYSETLASTAADDGYITRIYYPDAVPQPPQNQGSSVQRIQQQSLSTPAIGPVTPIAHDQVMYEWSYTGTTLDGFQLLNELDQVATSTASPLARQIVEEGLSHNTLVSGRKIAAYLGSTRGNASPTYPDVYTHMIPVTPNHLSRVDDRIRVGVIEDLNNLQTGQSGVQFELMPADSVSVSTVITTDWQQISSYTFYGTDPNLEYYVRARSRNYDGIVTPWSSNVLIRAQEFQAPIELLVDLKATVEGKEITDTVHPNEFVQVEVNLLNNGALQAKNVFLTVPLPPYLSYVPNSLVIDGKRQSEIPDGDAGQVAQDTIAAIWPTLDFAIGHTMRFTLVFDTPRLIEDFFIPVTESTELEQADGEITSELGQPTNETTKLRIDSEGLPKEPIRAPFVTREDLFKLLRNIEPETSLDSTDTVRASAGPTLQIQAIASDDSTDEPTYSNPVMIEPELTYLVTYTEIESEEPVPEPVVEEEPVVIPTPEELVVIQELLQPSPSAPALEQGQTTTNIGGGGFSVQTQSGGGTSFLGLTGQANVNEDQIEFTGTTTEPFTVVTLIFNESVTTIAVSDANGVWRTFVSADELGINPGQRQGVRIEAIAAKGTLRSERVEVGTVNIVRAIEGDIATQPVETSVSSSVVVRAVEQAAVVIQAQEPAIQTSLAVVAPVVVATSIPLWGYLPYVPTLLYHFFTYLIGLLGRKKKQDRRFYGIVYDSITKQPLALAIIRIYNKETNKLVSTQVSDKQGRYEALLEPATYRLEVTKPTYTFPSQIVTSEIDGTYQHIYKNEQGMQVQEQDLVIPDVPLDPVNAQRQWQLSSGLKKVWMLLQKVGNYLAVPVLIIGSVASVLVVIAIPENAINWVLAALYIVMLAAQLKLHTHVQKAWGVVYDIASNAVLPLATIQLIDPQYGKVVTSRLTDYQGRYSFLPEPGTYVVKASKPGFEQVAEVVEAPRDRSPITQGVNIDKPDQRITGDVPMKQA